MISPRNLSSSKNLIYVYHSNFELLGVTPESEDFNNLVTYTKLIVLGDDCSRGVNLLLK